MKFASKRGRKISLYDSDPCWAVSQHIVSDFEEAFGDAEIAIRVHRNRDTCKQGSPLAAWNILIMKRLLPLLLTISFFTMLTLSVMADTFSGVVIDASVYSIIVKKDDIVKIFQLRPETQGDRYPHAQDTVVVEYREAENGVLVAERITIKK